MIFEHVPVELRDLPQWCLAAPDKSPWVLGHDNHLIRSSPEKGPWLSFEKAVELSRVYNCLIGFVTTKKDPFCCIDLDIKDRFTVEKDGHYSSPDKYTPLSQLAHYTGILDFADSYAEFSTRGKGLHIWVKATIPKNVVKDGIEIYHNNHFIICTDDVVSKVDYLMCDGVAVPVCKERVSKGIKDGQKLVNNLINELGATGSQIDLVEVDQVDDDDVLWERAVNASNADKFKNLCEGDWGSMGYDSQSDADLALMSMLAYYTQSNEQCRRMFRQTVLGQRKKAVKDDYYLNLTLRTLRNRQASDKAVEAHSMKASRDFVENLRMNGYVEQEPVKPDPKSDPIVVDNYEVDPRVKEIVKNIDQTIHSAPADNTNDYKPPDVEGLAWPPGFVGSLAAFIYKSAPRPVKEVAIATALGVMAGILGKAYNVNKTGLNLYIFLIARSGVGKDAMHTGVGHLLNASCAQAISHFIDFTNYASGPALIKTINKNPSFVNINGEIGHKLPRFSADGRDSAMQSLKSVLLDLYTRSASNSVVGGIGYSNKEQNVDSTGSVAYTLLGESTPSKLYESLTTEMMESGFLSRFNLIHYHGERPDENENIESQVPLELSQSLGTIASHALRIIRNPGSTVVDIKYEAKAKSMIDKFNLLADNKVRVSGDDEAVRQIWVRAHLKLLRVAGILAASDNHITPIIKPHHVDWALTLINSDNESMLDRIEQGDVGADDQTRYKKITQIIKNYIKKPPASSYNISQEMWQKGIVPWKYLQIRTSGIGCFKTHRLGSRAGLVHTVQDLIDSGSLVEIGDIKKVQDYDYHGRAFQVLNL